MSFVAIQGIAGSYSEQAALELLGSGVSILECSDFENAFSALRDGRAGHAVVPIENKIVGEIAEPVRRLRSGEFKVLEQFRLPVRHILAGTPDAEFSDLVSVRSHIEALKQCGKFLSSQPRLTQQIGSDTASSVRRVIEAGDRTRAAICSSRAAMLYGAKILREDIADDNDNWTVFYLLGN